MSGVTPETGVWSLQSLRSLESGVWSAVTQESEVTPESGVWSYSGGLSLSGMWSLESGGTLEAVAFSLELHRRLVSL